MVIKIKQVIATHRHEWNKWPDTNDKDYSDILEKRDTWFFRKGEETLEVENRYLPVYKSYIDAIPCISLSQLNSILRFPQINNIVLPPESVMQAQAEACLSMSVGADSLLWEHTHQCHEPISNCLPTLFPKLRIISFGDDCPGSSDIKTFPVCHNFNTLVHSMMIYDHTDGRFVSDEYKKRGVNKTYFIHGIETTGLTETLTKYNFDINKKLQNYQMLPYELVFIGAFMRPGNFRGDFFAALLKNRDRLGMRCLYKGVAMPDGVLQPRDPPHPMGIGFPVAQIYIKSRFGFNLPVSSICNTRMIDLALTGTIQFSYDRWQEMERIGFVPFIDYIPIEGNAPDLAYNDFATKIKDYKQKDMTQMAMNAYNKAKDIQNEHGWTSTYRDVYFDFFG